MRWILPAAAAVVVLGGVGAFLAFRRPAPPPASSLELQIQQANAQFAGAAASGNVTALRAAAQKLASLQAQLQARSS